MTLLATAFCNLKQAILTSCRSSYRLTKGLFHFLLWSSQAREGSSSGIARCTFPALVPRAALNGHRKSTRRSTQRLGSNSIATAVAVISTYGRDLNKIPDRSLALLEMTKNRASIIPLLGGARGGFTPVQTPSPVLRGGLGWG